MTSTHSVPFPPYKEYRERNARLRKSTERIKKEEKEKSHSSKGKSKSVVTNTLDQFAAEAPLQRIAAHQRPVHNKKEAVQPLVLATVEVNQQAIKIQEADWHRAGLLMPMSVRELMRRRESEVS